MMLLMSARKNHHAILEQVYVEMENFSFTFIDAEDYAASEKWQKIFISILVSVNVAMVEY
jgi:hypothetical protein